MNTSRTLQRSLSWSVIAPDSCVYDSQIRPLIIKSGADIIDSELLIRISIVSKSQNKHFVRSVRPKSIYQSCWLSSIYSHAESLDNGNGGAEIMCRCETSIVNEWINIDSSATQSKADDCTSIDSRGSSSLLLSRDSVIRRNSPWSVACVCHSVPMKEKTLDSRARSYSLWNRWCAPLIQGHRSAVTKLTK